MPYKMKELGSLIAGKVLFQGILQLVKQSYVSMTLKKKVLENIVRKCESGSDFYFLLLPHCFFFFFSQQ